MITIEQARALTGHTEGPWWFDNNEGYGANNVWGNHKVDTQAKDFIAQAVGDSAEAEANGALIAAAPDLLELLLATADKLQAVQAENERLREERNHWIDVATKQATMIEAQLKEPKP